jgi:hypothetical protein
MAHLWCLIVALPELLKLAAVAGCFLHHAQKQDVLAADEGQRRVVAQAADHPNDKQMVDDCQKISSVSKWLLIARLAAITKGAW